ncbi:MAG: hypothetical protein Q8Q92_04740 [bacterium]|nr:hypothetical protein [bacterium]
MKKVFPHISAFLLTLVLVFAVSGFLLPQIIHAAPGDPCTATDGSGQVGTIDANGNCDVNPSSQNNLQTNSDNPGFWAGVVQTSAAWIVGMILKIVSLLTGLAAVVLNGVIYYTVVDVSNNYSKIIAISEAWGVIRDVANMGFIFVLLYAAIQTILGIGEDAKKLIVRVIVVAILINFSLFFTKIIIDVSNILALLFYDAIAPGAAQAGFTGAGSKGLSDAFMQHLSLTSLYKAGKLGVENIITIGVMGSVMLLIAAFVFFAAALMFIIRYVVLILVIILSPLAFMGWVLPALKKYWDQWWNALSGQAFFAPIYFMLTWVALHVLGGIMTSFGTPPVGGTSAALSGLAISGDQTNLDPGTFAMLINFIVVIVFLIVSLIVAKEWANKAGPGAAGLTKWAMGAAGGATLGMAGRFGRGTVGRAGTAIGDSEKLKERAAKGGVGGMAARLALATGRKTAGSSFDIRGTGLGGTLQAGQAQKGGFTQFKKDRAEAESKFATSLAPSAKAIAKDKTLSGNKDAIDEEVKNIEKAKQKRISEIKDSEVLKAAEKAEKSAYDTVSNLEAEAGAAKGVVTGDKIKALENAKRRLEEIKKEAGEARKKIREEIEIITARQDAGIKYVRGTEVEATSDIRKEKFAQTVQSSPWAKIRGYNYDAAAQIRKGKSPEKAAVEALERLQKEGKLGETSKDEEKTETPPVPPTVGTTPNP